MRAISGPRAVGFILAFALVLPGTGVHGEKDPPSSPEEPFADRPNVLIIITDDQRPTLRTMPKTRRWFGRDGTRFTGAMATTPTCCPSRASLMSGTYAHNHGVWTSRKGANENLDRDQTLQRYLSEAGYRTGIFGKYFNRVPVEMDPEHFDSWAIFAGSSPRGYRGGMWNVEGVPKRIKLYSTDFLRRRAVRFLRNAESTSQPWFLFVSPWAPHQPFSPARRHARAPLPPFRLNPAMRYEDRSDKPPYVRELSSNMKRVREVRRGQLRSLMAVDEMVHAIFKQLEASGELENTLAFFLSDHGFHWGEHGATGKHLPYTPSLAIPFYARWPGRFAAGTEDDRLVAPLDVAPTVFEATGIEPKHVVDGRSLFSPISRDRLLIEHWPRDDRTFPDWASLRTVAYQYTEHYLAERFVPTFREYYDLVDDPWQLQNVLASEPGFDPSLMKELSLQIAQDVRCSGTAGPLACP